jgi:hypothetical protein
LLKASDESFVDLDPQVANFERRIKAHKEYEDELSAQDLVKKDLITHADALIKEGHFAADAITARKDGIVTQWEALVDRSAMKRQRLQECHECVSVCPSLCSFVFPRNLCCSTRRVPGYSSGGD